MTGARPDRLDARARRAARAGDRRRCADPRRAGRDGPGTPTARSSTTTRVSPRSSAAVTPIRELSALRLGLAAGRAWTARPGADDRFAPGDPVDVRLVAGPDQPAGLVRARAPRSRRTGRAHGEAGLDAIARLATDWPFLSSLLRQRRDEPGQGRHGRSPAHTRRSPPGPGDDRRWATIEAEFRRTVALLGRVTGRERLLDGAPVLQRSVALRNPYVDSLSELQVRLLARLRSLGRRRPGARPGPAARPADRERRRGRAPEHGLAVDHRTTSRCCEPAVEPGGTWADIGAGTGAFTLALAELLGRAGGSSRWTAMPARSAQMAEGVARAFPQVAVDSDRRRLPPAAASCRRSTAWLPPTASTSSPATGRPKSSARWPRTFARRAVRRRRVRRRPRQPVGAAPFSYRAWMRLADAAGLVDVAEIGRVPSRFLGAIYSAVARRPG